MYNFSVARHFCACALTLETHKLLLLSHENYPVPKYSADAGGASGLAALAPAEARMYRLIGELSPIFSGFDLLLLFSA